METSKPAIFQHLPNGVKLIFVVLIAFLSFLFLISLSLVIAGPVFGISSSEVLSVNDSNNINFLKLLQVAQSIGLFIIPPFLIGYFFYRKSINYLKLDVKPDIRSAFLVIAIMFIALPAINLFAEINIRTLNWLFTEDNWMKDAEDVAMATTKQFLNVKSFWGMLFNVFMIAVLPAIGEELLFRGVVQKIFIDIFKNTHLGIILAAFLFSFIHFQFYGFLPRFLMGIFFGYLFVWSKNIWIPIIAHFVNNCIAVVASYLIHINKIPDEIETVGMSPSTFILSVASLVIIGFLIFLLYKQEKRIL